MKGEMYWNNKNFQFDNSLTQDFKQQEPSFSGDQRKEAEKIKMVTDDYTIKLILSRNEEEFDRLFQELLDKRKELGLPALIDQWNREYVRIMEEYK